MSESQNLRVPFEIQGNDQRPTERRVSAPDRISQQRIPDSDQDDDNYDLEMSRVRSDPSSSTPAKFARLEQKSRRLVHHIKRGQEKQAPPKQIFTSMRKQLHWVSHQASEPTTPAARGRRTSLKPLLRAAAELIDFPDSPKKDLGSDLPPLPRTLEQPESEQFLGSLTVVTFNVWTNHCIRNVSKQIKGLHMQNPDVICLQEVFHMSVFEAFRNAFSDYECVAFGRNFTPTGTFVFLLGLVLWTSLWFVLLYWILGLFFGELYWFWPYLLFPASAGLVHLCTRNHYFIAFLLGNLTGMALFVRKGLLRGQCSEKVMFSYPDGLEEDFLNGLRPRGFLSVFGTLDFRDGKSIRLRLVTTHLNQPPEQPSGRGRHQQVNEIFEHCLKEDEVFIIAGDFNATPPGTNRGTLCETYSQVSEQLSDAWTSKNGGDPNKDGLTWDQEVNPMCQTALNSIFYGQNILRWRCDYVFWRSSCDLSPGNVRVNLRSCQLGLTDENVASDHFAIVAVYDFFET